jgi:hypothetical protein
MSLMESSALEFVVFTCHGLTYWHGGAMACDLVGFTFEKTDMTIHIGLFSLPAFILVAIPTLLISTTTNISLRNQLEPSTAWRLD